MNRANTGAWPEVGHHVRRPRRAVMLATSVRLGNSRRLQTGDQGVDDQDWTDQLAMAAKDPRSSDAPVGSELRCQLP